MVGHEYFDKGSNQKHFTIGYSSSSNDGDGRNPKKRKTDKVPKSTDVSLLRFESFTFSGHILFAAHPLPAPFFSPPLSPIPLWLE